MENADDDEDTFISIGVQAALVISKLVKVKEIQERNVDKQRGRQEGRDKKTDADDQHDRRHLAKIG